MSNEPRFALRVLLGSRFRTGGRSATKYVVECVGFYVTLNGGWLLENTKMFNDLMSFSLFMLS